MRKKMEVANLVCKAVNGDKVLLDIFQNYFFQALKNQIVTGYHNSETLNYQFIDLQIGDYDGELVLSGRLVKSLRLEREQILDENKNLQDSVEYLRSDPSSFFVLLLKNHKLLFVREVKRAPALKDLAYVIRKMLQNQREEIISDLHQIEAEKLSVNGKLSLNNRNELEKYDMQLYRDYPTMDLEITPIGNIGTLEDNFEIFDRIVRFSVKTLRTNNEMYNQYNRTLQGLQKMREDSDSKYITTELHGDQSTPLKKEIIKDVTKAASDGNYNFTIRGYDKNNHEVVRKEDNFSLSLQVVYDKANAIVTNVKNMLEEFSAAVGTYHTSYPSNDDEIAYYLQDIRKNMRELNG